MHSPSSDKHQARKLISVALSICLYVLMLPIVSSTPRLTQAPQDVDFALGYVKEHARTRAEQEAVLAALRFKCDVLWTQLDALYLAYVDPGMIPPGAFIPEAFVPR